MKPVDRRKAVRDIRRLCRKHGVSFEEISSRGNGSHGSWVFSDEDGSTPIRVVIVYDKEISPVVQRSVVQRLKERLIGELIKEGAQDLVQTVLDMLEDVFSG